MSTAAGNGTRVYESEDGVREFSTPRGRVTRAARSAQLASAPRCSGMRRSSSSRTWCSRLVWTCLRRCRRRETRRARRPPSGCQLRAFLTRCRSARWRTMRCDQPSLPSASCGKIAPLPSPMRLWKACSTSGTACTPRLTLHHCRLSDSGTPLSQVGKAVGKGGYAIVYRGVRKARSPRCSSAKGSRAPTVGPLQISQTLCALCKAPSAVSCGGLRHIAPLHPRTAAPALSRFAPASFSGTCRVVSSTRAAALIEP